MKKNIKKLIALTVALTSVCSIGNISGFNLFEKAYAASSVLDKGELKSLSVKSIEGDNMEFLENFDSDDIEEYDGKDRDFKVVLPKGSDGVKVSAQVKGKSKNDKKDNKEDDENYVIRIFTSNKGDAKAYETGDEIYLYDDITTLYIRTYKSEEKFRDAKNDDNVTNCAETYKVVVKKEEILDEDYKEETNNTTITDTILPKISTSTTAVPIEHKNEWVKAGQYWLRYNEKGQALKNAWYMDESNNKYYYLQPNGYMTTGLRFIDGDWYYFNQSGEMMTGWVKASEGKWIYLMPSGKMAKNTTIDGYYLNSKGEYNE